MYSTQSLIHDPVLLRLVLALIILLITFFAKRILSKTLIKCLSRIKINKLTLDFSLFDHLQKPINYLLIATGIFLTLAVSPFVYYRAASEQILTIGDFKLILSLISIDFIFKIYQVAFVGIATWIVYDLEMLYEQFFTDLNDKHGLIDNTVFIRYIAKIIRFITIILGVAIALTILFPDLSGLATGVGIGGVAVAYISKDSFSSLLSGMFLLLDKPFVIGDWITIDSIDGIVEDISFRSTRIRTFSQSLVVIPNNTIGNANIINWSRMEKRRVSFDLGVSYNTSESQLKQCVADIKNLIVRHPDIESNTALVHFISFGDYSLNIQIIYYTLKTDLASYSAIKEAVNLEILDLCNRYQVEIAFPTQTIYTSIIKECHEATK